MELHYLIKLKLEKEEKGNVFVIVAFKLSIFFPRCDIDYLKKDAWRKISMQIKFENTLALKKNVRTEIIKNN